ncbi:MAG TPA: bifunctional 3,4-dihydroxy-2-butanone-4-phosphate synthase/GTP cyclohydrolase II [Ilumatobacter sp.]|nr:bifunctional 3,4-dihydroxy-2-butanone-4-phosphate synthase/GTP cyclohydrolase II [Ilumatobacter sp.]
MRRTVFDPIGEAIAAIARGEIVVVADDEDRENEGDLIMAADLATEEQIAFFVRHTSGVICVGLTGERCDELQLPLMVSASGNTEAQGTAFTVTVDLAVGTSTGISAGDRARTLRALTDPNVEPGAFNRPGHIFPLRARPGGTHKRAGHTEAAVDLARLAGRYPAGVLCEVVLDTGEMARVADLRAFADRHGLLFVSIADLIRHRRRTEKLITRTAAARVPTEWGEFRCYAFQSHVDGGDTHLAFVKGDVGGRADVLVRVHSECITGDVFASVKCDCGAQLHESMRRIDDEGHGVVVYLRGHEGRGIGITHKLRAYELQDGGADTIDANLELGLPVDSREYGIGAQILADLGLTTIRLLTNNPAKHDDLDDYDLTITERVPLHVPAHPEAQRYLDTKRLRMGHLLPDPQQTPATTSISATPSTSSTITEQA